MAPDYDDRERKELISEVKFGLNLLVVVFKNYALYPESNHIRRSSLDKFHHWLSAFLAEHERLFLVVGKDTLFFLGEPVLYDKPGEPALITPLFRDGVQWVEFIEGLEAEELETFVILLGRFRTLKEEAEDDLVTAMWEAAFSHINYKTAEEFWDLDPLIDLSTLKVVGEETPDGAWGGSGALGGGTGGGGVGNSEFGGLGGGVGGGVGAGLATGTAFGEEAAPGQAADVRSSSGRTPGEGSGPGSSDDSVGFQGGGQGPGQVVTLSAQAIAGEVDQLTALPVSSRAKPISALFAFADGDEETSSPAGVPAARRSDGGVLTGDDEAARSQEAVRLAIGLVTGRDEFFKFSREEKEALKTLIAIEETRNTTKDSLEVILIVFKNLRGAVDRGPILDFVAQEMILVLAQGKIYQVRVFIEKLKALASAGDPWMNALFDELMIKTATAEVLAALAPVWRIKNPPEAALAELKRLLLLLAPETARFLTPVLSQIIDQQLENTLLEVIAVKVIQLGGNPIEMLRPMKAVSIAGLIAHFHGPTPPVPTALMLALTKHESPLVREAAAQALLNDNPDNIRYLFHFIEDRNQALHHWFCALLGRRRNPLCEKHLSDYLEDHQTRGKEQDRARLLDCYRALGRCASAEIIPFLETILTRKTWKSFLGLDGSVHRLGAAVALMLLPEGWGAGSIIRRASLSPFRAIRQAVKEAEKEVNAN